MGYAAYNRWHRDAYRVARRLHEEIRFDLTHQVNFCGYREPGYLWKLPVPFIWGPIGGTQNYPWRFLSEASWKGAIRETVRSVINLAQLKWGFRGRKGAKKASSVLAANAASQRYLDR